MNVFWWVILGLFLLLTLAAWPMRAYSRNWMLKTRVIGATGC